jgi:predicted O-methyltransferase YrrM
MMGTERSLNYASRKNNRYWWYHLKDTSYVPPVFARLSDDEWALMDDWFTTTDEKFSSPGEMSVPAISLLEGLIGGNGICSVVQCGHYVGYSTLLLGFLLRRMGKTNALFSVDIDPHSTAFTQDWLDRADLGKQVKLRINDSANPSLPDEARSFFGRDIQMVMIDSSHQYAHTLQELDLWYDALPVGGILVMHDVSRFAQSFDTTGKGGVLSAAHEWTKKRGITPLLLNSFVISEPPDTLTYRDGCGLGIIQKQ